MTTQTTPNIAAAVQATLRTLFRRGDVVEVRALRVPGRGRPFTVAGYFDSSSAAGKAVAELEKIRQPGGVYCTINEVNPALLARSPNMLTDYPDHTTSDTDILHRRWLPLDFDAVRPTGVSSTDAEHDAALQVARDCRDWLTAAGWPAPILADSGNGAHLLYRIDLPADDDGLVGRCLAAIAARLDAPDVVVDTSVSNPSRIWRLYGTTARKGHPTADRPHRRSCIIDAPEAAQVVPVELLTALGTPPATGLDIRQCFRGNGQQFDIDRFIQQHALEVDQAKPWEGGRRWVFRHSPLCDHHDGAAFLCEHASGALTAGCHHQSCSWTWQDLRSRFDPAAAEKPRSAPRAAAVAPAPGRFPWTDTGLAERFAAQHAGKVRYCWPWQKWLSWDGRRWRIDDAGAVEAMAKDTARGVLAEAAAEHDDTRRKALVSFARSAESAVRRAAMLRLARSETGVPVLPAELDRDPWLLTAENGTIDLRTGTLRDHSPCDNITKLAPVEFHPEADAPTWLDFRAGIFGGCSAIDQFVQRLAGYCLTGIVRDQVLPIFWGTGANGKSTLINALLAMLGEDYGMKAVAELLMARRDNEHPTERADLHGKRLVAAVETGEGRRLAESVVKELTGGDRIRARRMREDYWEFTASHKIILATNHKPEVRGTDHAIWRRLRLVPFTVCIPDVEQDKALPEKLHAELPGIFAWAVQGCLAWQRHGLGEPEEVRAATAAYRSDQDTLGRFLAECCMVDASCRVRASDLLAEYQNWSSDVRMTQRRFGTAMTERGFTRVRSSGIWYEGIGLQRSFSTE
ncbi:MAG: phage/plasmid primase, P4 family [Thermoguttaceae bacterium]|jgi:putative DNA primase/helicase|nr:phage/plasmid primase, P4 family [Thermoguttaceae bacterium]